MGKSSETQTQTSTMDPRQERYIRENIQPLASEIAGMEFTPFKGERVQQLTPLQRDVLGGYGNLTLPSELTEATDIYRSVAQMTPEELSARRSGYQQEYLDAILDPQRRRLRREQAIQRTGEEADIIRGNAYGSRGDVYAGEREAARDVAMGALEADIARAGFDYGGQRLAQDLGFTMGAAGSLAGAGMTGLQGQMGILGAKMGAGEAERLIGQQGLDAAYQEELLRQQFPLTQFSTLVGGSAAFPAGIGTTTGTTTRSDPMAGIGMGLQALGGFGMAGIGPLASLGAAGSGVKANPLAFT